MNMRARLDADQPSSRRPARDIIEAVVENMRASREPLKYSVLAPNRYTVYLHPSEFARLQDIVPLLQEETARALSEEVDRLNRQPRVPRWMSRLAGQRAPDLRNPSGEWHIEFVADPDGELHEGDLLVDSQLVLPGRPELGVGERTRRITTILRGPQTITKAQTTPAASGAAKPPVLAQISYEDAAGPHIYDIVRDALSIGRGGITFPVDLRVECSADVSREHARLRRDTATGRFFLIDLSSLGTTLNGRHVPRGYDEVDGRKRENGAETALPEQARIGLADTVFLDFRQVR